MKTSDRLKKMRFSSIRELTPFAEMAQSQGKNVIKLNIGQPDIKTPKIFYEKIRSFKEDTLKYSSSRGEDVLINAIINYYKNKNIEYKKEDIFITNGGSEALLFALLVSLDQGDEVLVPEPFYSNYGSMATMVGVNIKTIETKKEENFNLPDYNTIKKLITNKTKAFLITNPNNPTGAVYSKEQLLTIVKLAVENNMFIIADEVYREFVYDNIDTCSFGNFKKASENLILVDSVSKRFSACGARIGALITKNKDVQNEVMKMCQVRLSCPTIEQIGASGLYEVEPSYLEKIREEYKKRRDYCYERLSKIKNVHVNKPLGAFYMITKLPVNNSREFAKWLLKDFSINNETVMLAPILGFYKDLNLGKNEVRISYVLSVETLERAFNILEKGLILYEKGNI